MKAQKYNQIGDADNEVGISNPSPLIMFAQIYDSREPLELNNGFLR